MRRYPDKSTLTYDRLVLRYANIIAYQSMTGAASPIREQVQARVLAIDFERLPLYDRCRYYHAFIDAPLLYEDEESYERYGSRALEVAQQAEDPYLILQSMFFLQSVFVRGRQSDTFAELAEKVQDPAFLIARRVEVGGLAMYSAKYDEADRLMREAYLISQGLKNAWGTIVSALNMIRICFYRGALDEGWRFLKTTHTFIEDYRMSRWLPDYVAAQVTYLLAEGNVDAAAKNFQIRSAGAAAEVQDMLYWIAYVQGNRDSTLWETLPASIKKVVSDPEMTIHLGQWGIALAMVHALSEDMDAAVEVLAAALANRHTPDWYATDHVVVRDFIADLRGKLDGTTFKAVWVRGESQDIEAMLRAFVGEAP